MRKLELGELRLHDERFPNGCIEFRKEMLQALRFESRAEYACATLLEKYVPDWKCEIGKTYQVPIGLGKKCDFKVKDVFVEYHVVVFAREFEDGVAFRKFDNAIRKVSAFWRHQIKEAIFSEFLERYYKKRKFCIEAGPETKGSELILAHSPQTFFHLVLKRFGKGVPGLKEIQKEFTNLQQG